MYATIRAVHVVYENYTAFDILGYDFIGRSGPPNDSVYKHRLSHLSPKGIADDDANILASKKKEKTT